MWYKSDRAARDIIINAIRRADADIIAIQEGAWGLAFRQFAKENG